MLILLISNTAYAAQDSSIEFTIDKLLSSTNPHDHMKALEIMEQNGADIKRETINEFETLKKLNEQLLSGKLNRSTYSIEELDCILNYREKLSTKIEELKKESDEILKRYNYSAAQIEAIRNFDGSDEMLTRASSSCTVYGGFNNFSHNSSGSSAQMVAAFRWDGAYVAGSPFASKDIFAVTWCSPFIEQSSTGHLLYKNVHYNNTVQSTVSVKADDLYVSSIIVPNNKSESVSGVGLIGHTIESGSIISNISTKTNTPEVVGYAAYGLSTFSFNPSVSVSSSGAAGAGLSFSSNVSTVGSARFSQN